MVVRGIVPLLLVLFASGAAGAQDLKSSKDDPSSPQEVWREAQKPKNLVATLEILLLLTTLTLAPSILVMMTCFTRIVIVLSFVRRALATQELPPNQVVVGLSLFLTMMVMMPTFEAIRRDAIEPYTADPPRITLPQAKRAFLHHSRDFMFRFARLEDLQLFMETTRQPKREGGWRREDVPTTVLIPSFVLSELRRAFIMGFALFLPFMVIDMVVASTLISMGMLVLPPVMISLPFKILLFILVDGWHLVVGSLIQSFYV